MSQGQIPHQAECTHRLASLRRSQFLATRTMTVIELFALRRYTASYGPLWPHLLTCEDGAHTVCTTPNAGSLPFTERLRAWLAPMVLHDPASGSLLIYAQPRGLARSLGMNDLLAGSLSSLARHTLWLIPPSANSAAESDAHGPNARSHTAEAVSSQSRSRRPLPTSAPGTS